jgi:hypothetical protein
VSGRGPTSPDVKASYQERMHARYEAWKAAGRPTKFWQEYRPDQAEDQAAGARSSAETAPKRPEIKPATKPAVPAAAAKQIKSEFSFALWLADQGAAKAVPRYWITPDDRLADDERTMLVNATYNELEARFPKLLKALAKVQENATEAALLYAIAIVAAPRLARHGVIPAELASAIVFAPIILANAQQSVAESDASAVGAESASQPDREYRNGQIDASGAPTPVAEIRIDPPEQTGLGDIFNGSGDPDRARNGRYPQ